MASVARWPCASSARRDGRATTTRLCAGCAWVSFALPPAWRQQYKGAILALAGRWTEAEPSFRAALALVENGGVYPRERVFSSLGHALTSLGRFEEAEEFLNKALGAGDVTGNSLNGLAQLRLAQERFAEALGFADQAIEAARRRV